MANYSCGEIFGRVGQSTYIQIKNKRLPHSSLVLWNCPLNNMLTFLKSPAPQITKQVVSPSSWPSGVLQTVRRAQLLRFRISVDSKMDGIQKRSALRLNDLPLEMLISILEKLEWRGVLQLRKVRFKTSMWHVSNYKLFTPPDLHSAL